MIASGYGIFIVSLLFFIVDKFFAREDVRYWHLSARIALSSYDSHRTCLHAIVHTPRLLVYFVTSNGPLGISGGFNRRYMLDVSALFTKDYKGYKPVVVLEEPAKSRRQW